jgi:hypothetical protein
MTLFCGVYWTFGLLWQWKDGPLKWYYLKYIVFISVLLSINNNLKKDDSLGWYNILDMYLLLFDYIYWGLFYH